MALVSRCRATAGAGGVGQGVYLLLVDTAIKLYDTGVDWLELTLDISWSPSAQLTVNAAVEVACWCPQDHDMHQVREAQRQVATSGEMVAAFAAGTAMLMDVLDNGPFEPDAWRDGVLPGRDGGAG